MARVLVCVLARVLARVMARDGIDRVRNRMNDMPHGGIIRYSGKVQLYNWCVRLLARDAYA